MKRQRQLSVLCHPQLHQISFTSVKGSPLGCIHLLTPVHLYAQEACAPSRVRLKGDPTVPPGAGASEWSGPRVQGIGAT